jgi:hypothetical protein
MDGDPSGRIKCTLANWTGVVYKIPRTELEKCKGRRDLMQSGVYFLFGISDQTDDSVAYIGQAGIRKNGEGILYRLQEHKRNPDKDYWTEAVVFTTSNNSFGPTEISYLENRFTKMATETKRYIIKNGNDPNPGHITEEKESELEEFIDYAKIVMGTLGHRIFEPLITNTHSEEGAILEAKADSAQIILEIKQRTAEAKGQQTNEGFVLMKGSRIKPEISPTLRDAVRRLRERYSPKIDAEGILQEDILLRSPNEAAHFTLGYPVNALITWKTADGKTLKEIEVSETGEPLCV